MKFFNNPTNYLYDDATNISAFISEFTIIEKTFCRWTDDIYGRHSNLDDAVSACKADANCGKILDVGCDNDGVFQLCKTNAETKQSNKGSCIYEPTIGN